MATLRAGLRDDAALARRLDLLMFGRMVLALLGIGGILAAEGATRELPFSRWPTYSVLTFAFGINVLWLFLARLRTERRVGPGLPTQAVLQLLADVAVVTALTYLTGIEQVFIYLYFATVIMAAVLIGGRGALVFASTATILLSAVTLLFRLVERGFEFPFITEDRALEIAHSAQVRFILPYLVSFGLSLHLVAVLAGALVREARRIRVLHEELLQNLDDGVVAVDHFGAISFANSAALEFLGQTAGARGRKAREVLPAPIWRIVEEVLEGRPFGGWPRPQRLALGGVSVEVTVTPLRSGPWEDARGVLVRIADVSLRDQLVRVTATAERSRALLEMSAAMAHEIRNPLASIRSAAAELGELPAATPDDRMLLAVLARESDRLNKIISDFLEFASDRKLEIRLCDVSQIVREAADVLAAREEVRGGGVRLDVRAPTGMVGRADTDRLKQVLLNLAINAVEAVGTRGQVGLRVTRAPDRIVPAEGNADGPVEGILVEVEDTGPGIPIETLPKIFDPFFTTKPRGTGMGLAVARNIVRRHEGQIVVENRPEGGARARVWLPV
jgi:signal transduction histidine kinase